MAWFGHLERKDAGDWVSACSNGYCMKCWKRQNKKRWNEVVKDDLKKCGLDRGLAKDGGEVEGSSYGKTSDLCEHGQGTQNERVFQLYKWHRMK